MTTLVIGAAVAILFFATDTAADAATSDSPEDLDSVSGAGADSSIQNFASAIAFAEGYWDINENIASGVLPVTNNNPGDIGGGSATYGTIDEGWAALYAQLQLIANGASKYYSSSMSIQQMGVTYAGDGVNWPANVCYFLNTNYGLTDSSGNPISPATPLAEVLS